MGPKNRAKIIEFFYGGDISQTLRAMVSVLGNDGLSESDMHCMDDSWSSFLAITAVRLTSQIPSIPQERRAFVKHLRSVLGLSTNMDAMCKMLQRRVRGYAHLTGSGMNNQTFEPEQVPTIKLIEKMERGGDGILRYLPEVKFQSHSSFPALKVESQYLELMARGLKYGVLSEHRCRHKCVCGEGCSLCPNIGKTMHTVELKMVASIVIHLRNNFDRSEISVLESAGEKNHTERCH